MVERLESRVMLDGSPVGEVAAPWQPPSRFVHQPGGYLSKATRGTPVAVALGYLAANSGALGLTRADVADPVVTDAYTDRDTGVTHVYLQQRVNGIAVVNATMNVNVTRDGRVLSVGGGFVAGASTSPRGARAVARSAPVLAAAAVDAAHALFPGAGRPRGQRTVALATPRREPQRFSAPALSKDPVTTKLEYLATPAGLKLSWQFAVRTTDDAHWYSMAVDANTGAPLAAHDWVSRAAYNVYAAPTETPVDGTRTLLTDPHDPTYSPYGWHDTNGVAGPEFTDTRGNNVSAQDDVDANNTGGSRPSGGAGLSFDFPLDLALAPSGYRDAATTNLFYWNNLLHDVHARYGFTEPAGNFQTLNYGGAGLGGDAVQADAQDGSGTNNANFATPPDGQVPRMQMYLFNYTSPGRDGDLDNQIIVHEYGHGVSNRLTGGPANANALSAVQSSGMGEGWSDWWGLMFTMKATDTKLGRYPVGTYVLGENATTGAGIRRYPYSFDMAVDPLTIAHYNSDPTKEEHNTGEIWATVLWDLAWLLIEKHGYSADISQGYDPAIAGRNGGNNLALQLVTDALKLQPANPSFLQARDAILQADLVRTGGANRFQIWTAFARRGMGYSFVNASSAGSTVTPAFDVPVDLLKPRVIAHSPVGAQTAPVTAVDITFSKAMNPASFAVADDLASFTGPGGVDLRGQVTGFTWLNANTTLRVSFAAQSANGSYALTVGPQILAGDDGSAMDQNSDGTAGQSPADRYTANFAYDAQALAVVSSAPANGSTVTIPFTTIELAFNEAVDPASVGTGDVTLSQGTVTGAGVVAGSGGLTVRYTVAGVTAEGALTFALAAGAVTDASGFPGVVFNGSVNVDIGTRALPAMTQIAPAGSLVYQTSSLGAIGSAADVDEFTIALDAGQTLTVVVTPAGGLRPALEVRGPGGGVLGAATAAAAGKAAVVQTVAAGAAGTYTIAVGAAGGTTGAYAVGVTLNAAAAAEDNGGAADDSVATAQPLTGWTTLVGGSAITSVLGRLPTPTGNLLFGEDFDAGSLGAAWSLYASTAQGQNRVGAFSTPAAGAGALFQDTTSGGTYNLNEAVWTVNLAGVASPKLTFAANTYSEESDALPATFTGHANGDGVAISVDGNTWYTVWQNTSPSTWTTVTVDLAAAAATAGITLGPAVRVKFQQYDNFELGTDGIGWDSVAITTPTPALDYYAVTATAGRRLTLAAARTGGTGTPAVTLYDAEGAPVATGAGGPTNVATVIDEYLVLTTGTYYVRVAGTSADYTLVVTRDAALDLEPAAPTTPLALGGRTVAVGSVSDGNRFAPPVNAGTAYTGNRDLLATPLSLGFASDGSFIGPTVGARFNGIEYTRMGSFVSQFSIGWNGTYLTNGAQSGSGTGFAVTLEDVSAGTVHGIRARGTVTTGGINLGVVRTVWWNDGDAHALVATTLTNNGAAGLSNVAVLDNHDPEPGGTTSTVNDVVSGADGKYAVGSVAGTGAMLVGSMDPRAVASVESVTRVYNPFDVINSPVDPNGATNDYSLNVAFNAGALAAGATTTATYAMAFGATAAAAQAAYAGAAARTAGGAAADDDGYSIVLTAGQGVTFRTRTPGDGPGEFANALDVALDLYDPSGALVATDDDGAADGRNALLNAVATTAGTYTLRVRGTGGTAGEYVLDGAPAASADGRPGTPDLLAASDTGVSATDDLTRLDNGAPGRALQFMVPGTIPGATVELFVGGVLIGSAVAIGTSTLVTTDGATVLADGAHAITARQTPAGGTASPASDALGLTVKTATLAAPATPVLQAASDSGPSATDGLTNDATPTFDVTAGGAAYYRVYRDGAVVSGPGETAAAFTSAALADGTYAFTVSAVDAAGNESAPSPAATVTVDTVGPTAAITQPDVDAASDTGVSSTDNVTSVTAPTLAITLPPAGLYYRLLKDFTVLVGDAYATATSVTLPAQPDGATIWGLKYVDGAGNESIGGVGTTVTIDTVAPATPVAPDLQAASDTGASTTDDVTSDTTPTFDVVGAPYFRVYRDGVLVSTTYPSGTTYTSATLANGTYVFAVSSVDAAGNESARSAPISVTIDTTIPALPLLYSGSDTGQSTSDRVTRFNNATPAAALYLMIPLTPAGATVTLYADGVAVGSAVSAGAAMFVATDGSTVLADGVRAMSYRYALPGQPASPGSSILPVTVDATAPDAPGAPDVSSGSDTGASTSDDVTTSRTPSITVAAGGSFYRLFVDGAQASADYQAGTFTLPSRSDGAYVLTAVAVDAAGNVSAPSAATTLTIDNVEPFPPLVAPDLQDASDSGTSNADNLTNDLTPTFDVPGVPAGGYFRVYRNGTVIGGSYQTGTSYTAPSQTSGTYAYTFAYVDAAGNVSLQSPGLTVTFDTAGPANVGAPDLQTASDSGSSSGDNVTNVRRPTFTLPAGVVPYWRFYQSGARISGLFETGATFTVPTDLADGTHQFTVRAVDDAGNESGTSSLGVTIDTTAPTAPTAAPDLQAASDTGGSTTDNYTADDTPTFAISGAGTTWRLYRGATLVSGAYQTGSTFTAPAQADGADAWTLVAVDPAGNESAPGPATTVTIDRAAPVVTVDVVATTLTGPALTGTVSEPGSQVTVVFEGASYPAAVAADGSWAVPAGVIPAVAPGTYDVVTTATDLAGNARTQTAVGVLRVGVPAPVMDAEPPATRGAQNTVAWAPVAGATAYYVEADADPEFGSPDASSGWIAGTSHTFTGLADGVTYHYRVRARQAVTNVGNWGQTTQAEFDAGARTGVVTTPAGQVVLATGTTVNLADDFEDGDFAGWTAVSPNYARQVTSATAGSGVYSLTMTGGNLTHSDGLYRTSFGATIPTRATFYVRGTVKHTSRGYFVLRGGTSKSAWFMMDNDGTMGLVSDGGLRQHNVPFVLDRWYRVTLDFDWAGKTIDYSVDGALVEADVPFYSSSATFVDRVDLYNFGSAQSYWDGIALSTTAYATSGTIVSAPISPAQRTAWGVLDYQAAQPAGTAILVDVLDGAGTVLASDLSSGADLAALGIAAPTIRLRARLSTTNAAVTPVLESWGVSFRRGADYTVESAWSAAVSSTQDATAPTVSVTALPTADTTPALAGTVDDPGAVVEVTVNGQAFAAVNNGDGTWALADGVVGPLPFGTQVVAVSATDAAGNKGTTARQLTVVPTPALASWVVNDGAAQRSMVKTVTLSFNTPVTLSTGAIRVYLRVAGGAVTAVTASVSNPTGDLQTYVLKFGAPSTDAAGSLADGAYDVVIASASVRDSLGRSPVGPDLVLTFHRLFGDADGDRDVDAADSSVFAAAQSTRAGASAFRWYFDGDGDTDVDAVDALRFRRQAGKSVSY